MPGDPYSDPVTGVLYNKLGLSTAAGSAGSTLVWQHLDAARSVEASAAIMRGDPEPMRKMLDALVRDGT
jgi:hypothetical protein